MFVCIQIPISSANSELQDLLERKKRLIVFNKMDLANPNMMLVSIAFSILCDFPTVCSLSVESLPSV